MKITNLTDAEFKTVAIRMLKELTEYNSTIPKTQEEMKDTVSEIKEVYREPTVERMKPRFKSMIWNIRKK